MTSLKYLMVYKIDGPALNDVKGETLRNEVRFCYTHLQKTCDLDFFFYLSFVVLAFNFRKWDFIHFLYCGGGSLKNTITVWQAVLLCTFCT